MYTTQLLLHWQINYEASFDIIFKIKPPLVWLWVSKVHVC